MSRRFTERYAMEVYWGNERIAPRILMRVNRYFHARAVRPREKGPGHPLFKWLVKHHSLPGRFKEENRISFPPPSGSRDTHFRSSCT